MNILKLFFEEPGREFNVREVARLVAISPATASRVLMALAKKGVIKQRGERRLKLYKADMDSDLYRDMKVFYNVRKLRGSGIIEELDRKYMKPAIVLFGSASFGMDTETSDFDLAVFSEKTNPYLDVSAFESRIKRKVHVLLARNPKELKNRHLADNVLNGVVIQGEVKWTSKNA